MSSRDENRKSPDAGTTLDLEDCDREPIHAPSAIQPYGMLLAAREDDTRILYVSANSEGFLRLPPKLVLGSFKLGNPELLIDSSDFLMEAICACINLVLEGLLCALCVIGLIPCFHGWLVIVF